MTFSFNRADLEKRAKDLLPSEGEHDGKLVEVKHDQKMTGFWVHLTYVLATTQHRVPVSFLLKPSPHRQDLARVSTNDQLLLLDAIQATLGVPEVSDFALGIEQMKGLPVRVSIQHRTAKGRRGKVADIVEFRPSPLAAPVNDQPSDAGDA